MSSLLLWSTPYGIKGKGTLPVTSELDCRSVCSTPYGIIGRGTAIIQPMSLSLTSAQRLTASKVVALPNELHKQHREDGAQRLTASKVVARGTDAHVKLSLEECSTPDGIIDSSTLAPFRPS